MRHPSPRLTRRAAAAALAGFTLPWSAAQGTYPNKPINLVVPFPAGGRTDITARVAAEFLRQELGESLVILNRPGAGGVIGAKEVAKAPPDGYTLGFFSTGFLTTQYTVQTPTNVNEYELVSLVNFDPAAIAISAASPLKSLEEIVRESKARPGSLNVGVNTGSSAHVFAAAFFDAIGAKATFVSFKGGAERSVALAGGHIDLDFDIVAAMKPTQDAKKARILAIAADGRNPLYPDIPTMREQGVDLVISSWHGLFAPKGTPAPIVERLDRAMEAVARRKDFNERMTQQALGVRYLGRADFAKFYVEQDAIFKRIIDRLGLNAGKGSTP
ncbi:MAG TPA: tripartite tricarboxylate transporter substrate binding protein [Ramlibacter sp.]|nr:tripartite tricarboxylate transporter substrate binding protein [Ramlibacter sp.]